MEIRHLYKSFGEKVIFQDFSVVLPEGKFIALMGASGAGKTTLLRMLSGLEGYEGEIFVPKKKAIVFQESVFLEHLTLRKNLSLVGIKDYEKAVEQLGLGKDLDTLLKNFSGGMRRRASILRLVLSEKELFILDEPFKELDQENYEKTLNFVKNSLDGKSVIFSTHRESEAEFFEAKKIVLR